MVRLVDDLLDVSRIMHGKLQLERFPLSLGDVTRAALDALAPAFHAKGVLVVTEGMENVLMIRGRPRPGAHDRRAHRVFAWRHDLRAQRWARARRPVRGDAAVRSARDGREGLSVILERRPQIGLLDIGLPEMNGYDLALEIRRHLGNTIKLVAMSGYGQSEDLRKAEAAGFDRHLTKPVGPRRLAIALRELGIEEYALRMPDEESFAAPLS